MISLLIGKPGSGKSYHATREILRLLATDIKRKASRKVYTNVSLNIDEVNLYLTAELGQEVDVSERVIVLEDDFFVFDRSAVTASDYQTFNQGVKKTQLIRDDSLGYWWNRFENDAVIIIDEIQRFLGGNSKGDRSVVSSIAVYFSTHRHRRHEIILISQALTNIPLEIRKYAETVLEVFNAKSLSLPFPLSIQGRDIEIFLKGWGVQRQVYRVKKGILDIARPHIVEFQGEAEVVATSPAVYACYQSHTLKESDPSKVFVSDSDLPFELGPGQRWRAVKWIVKKYFPSVAFKVVLVILAVFFVKGFFHGLNEFAKSGFGANALVDNAATTKKSQSSSAPSKASQNVETSKPSLFNLSKNENVPAVQLKTAIMIAPDFIIVDRQKYYPGDALPSGLVLRSIDVRKRSFYCVTPYQDFLDGFRFLDYMGRLSSGSYCASCGG